MLKRTLRAGLLFASVAFMIALAVGCQKTAKADGAAPAESAKKEVTYLAMGTGGTAGTWYPVGGVLSAAMSKSGTVNVTAQTSAASLENIRLVGSGDRQLGLAAAGLLVYAHQGVEMFKGESYADLTSIANMMPNQFQFVVREGSGINSIMDLAGKVVGTGAPGSGDEVLARGILEALGLYGKVTPMQLSFGEQVTAFKNRQLDCIFAASPAPTSAILDAASQAKVKFLGFDSDTRAKVLQKLPFLVDDKLTSTHYNFITSDVATFAVFSTLFTSSKIPEQVIYDAVKAMYSDMVTINASHAAMAGFNMDMAVSGLPLPLHAGAAKFYKEQGKLK